MTYGPIWPTRPYDPTAIRLYGIDLEGITDRPNINISFLNESKNDDDPMDDNPVRGLSLTLFRRKERKDRRILNLRMKRRQGQRKQAKKVQRNHQMNRI